MGGGSAGLVAAVYGASEGLRTLVVDPPLHHDITQHLVGS
ncbi:MAG: hypothetical protein ACRDK3_05535 [Actinomycetota bacterium]